MQINKHHKILRFSVDNLKILRYNITIAITQTQNPKRGGEKVKITIEATSANVVKNELEKVAKYIQDLCNDYPDINANEIEVVIKSNVILP